MIKGKIDVIKTLHICDCGKKTNINQKGNTPRFNQRKIISIVKYVDLIDHFLVYYIISH